MHNFTDVLFEMEMRKKSIEAEIERLRRARLAAEAHSQEERVPAIRRVAFWLGDAAGLYCRWQRRFAAASGPIAC